MKSNVESQTPTNVRLTVEVPFDELDPHLRTVSRGHTDQADIAGFHGGRLPTLVIDPDQGTAGPPWTVQQAILTLVAAAAHEHDIAMLGRPEVEITSFGDGQALTFTALVDVRSDITLPQLDSITVAVEPLPSLDDAYDAQIEHLRRRLSTTDELDRPAAPGDLARIGLTVSVIGTSLGGGPAHVLLYEIGSGRLVLDVESTTLSGTEQLTSALDSALVGLSAGDVTTFTVELSDGEYAGRDADVAVTLTAVLHRRLPELDDAFAGMVGSFGTFDELRRELRLRLTRERAAAQMRTARDAVLKQLVAATAATAPEGLIRDEVEFRKQWMHAELERQGHTFDRYLDVSGRTEADIHAEMRAATAERICGQLVLDAVADAEDIEVTDEEIARELVHRARSAGVNPQAYQEQLARSGSAPALLSDARRGKALAVVMDRIAVTDLEGRPLAADDLRDIRHADAGLIDVEVPEAPVIA